MAVIKPADAASVFIAADGNTLDTNDINNIILEPEEDITFTVKLDSMETSLTAISYGVLVNNAELFFVSSKESGAILGHPFTTVEEMGIPSPPPIFVTEFIYTNPIGGVVPLNTIFVLCCLFLKIITY